MSQAHLVNRRSLRKKLSDLRDVFVNLDYDEDTSKALQLVMDAIDALTPPLKTNKKGR